MRTIGLGFFAVVAFNGIDDVALVFLGKDSLHSDDSAAGVLYAVTGVGLLVGCALLARYAAGGASMVPLHVVGFGASSAGNLLSGLAWTVAAAFVMQTMHGVGIYAMDVATNTLIQCLMPPAILSRILRNLYGTIGIAAGLSYVLDGLLLDLASSRLAFIHRRHCRPAYHPRHCLGLPRV